MDKIICNLNNANIETIQVNLLEYIRDINVESFEFILIKDIIIGYGINEPTLEQDLNLKLISSNFAGIINQEKYQRNFINEFVEYIIIYNTNTKNTKIIKDRIISRITIELADEIWNNILIQYNLSSDQSEAIKTNAFNYFTNNGKVLSIDPSIILLEYIYKYNNNFDVLNMKKKEFQKFKMAELGLVQALNNSQKSIEITEDDENYNIQEIKDKYPHLFGNTGE